LIESFFLYNHNVESISGLDIICNFIPSSPSQAKNEPRPALPTKGKPISVGMKGRLLCIRFGIAAVVVAVLALLPLCPIVPTPAVVEFRLFVRDDRTG
jgi:hypothetical protein